MSRIPNFGSKNVKFQISKFYTFCFFGHNSAPSSPIYMQLAGFFPTSLPDLFKPARTSKYHRKTSLLRHEHFEKSENELTTISI